MATKTTQQINFNTILARILPLFDQFKILFAIFDIPACPFYILSAAFVSRKSISMSCYGLKVGGTYLDQFCGSSLHQRLYAVSFSFRVSQSITL